MIDLQERLLELELALDRDNWIPIASLGQQQEFSRDGITRIIELARLNYIKNPLIQHGVNVQSFYVFGRGVSISAKDETINEVVQAFIDDKNNQRELTSSQARKAKDRELRIDGNIFFLLFTLPSVGSVRVSTITVDEVEDIIRNPENKRETWYYLRRWSVDVRNLSTGTVEHKNYSRYYRDFQYHGPIIDRIGGIEVEQDAVVYHIKVGGFSDWAFGISEVYAALDWAKAYKGFLEDFAKIVKSLARFAWRKKVSGGARGVQAAKLKLNSTLPSSGIETTPSPTTGSVLIQSENDGDLDPIKTQGSTTSADEGKPMRIMAGIAMGLPDNIASGDVDQGSRATAKSLDRPTEFQFADRQELWIGVYQTLLDYVIYQSVAAPQGTLRALGAIEMNDYDEPVVIWPDEVDTTIQVDFPPLLEADQLQQIQALVTGATFDGKQPSVITDMKLLARQVLIILGFDDVDAIVGSMYPDNQELAPLSIAAVNESLQKLIEVLRNEQA